MKVCFIVTVFVLCVKDMEIPQLRKNKEWEEIKMAKSLQSEFVKFYREKLEPLGFKKVKGRQPYFVRVVNDEILHIFTFRGERLQSKAIGRSI